MQCRKLHSFIPSGKNYVQAQLFFEELGFENVYADDHMSIFRNEGVEFFLQNFYNQDFQDNYMVAMSVEDLDGLWVHIKNKKLEEKYPIKVISHEETTWGRQILLIDPAGVHWYITEQPVRLSSVGGAFSAP